MRYLQGHFFESSGARTVEPNSRRQTKTNILSKQARAHLAICLKRKTNLCPSFLEQGLQAHTMRRQCINVVRILQSAAPAARFGQEAFFIAAGDRSATRASACQHIEPQQRSFPSLSHTECQKVFKEIAPPLQHLLSCPPANSFQDCSQMHQYHHVRYFILHSYDMAENVTQSCRDAKQTARFLSERMRCSFRPGSRALSSSIYPQALARDSRKIWAARARIVDAWDFSPSALPGSKIFSEADPLPCQRASAIAMASA